MIKAINQWAFPGLSIDEIFVKLKEAHFAAFEPALSETGELSLESANAEFVSVKQRAADNGIALTSLASGLYWAYSPTSNRPDTRKKAQDIIARQLETAKLLGVDAILVVPGSVGKGFWGGEDFVYYDDAYDRALDAINALKGYAQELGVTIGIENVWNNFLISPLEMRNFIDAVNSPRVGAYLDIGNVIKYGFPEMWVRILGKRICRVHVKDFKVEVGTLAGFVDLLSGSVNFPAVMTELKAVGYDQYLIAEMMGEECFPGNIVLRTSRALDTIIAGV